MENPVIFVERRENKGKSAARKLRAKNKIPAVVYGKDVEPLLVSVDQKEWNKFFKAFKRTTIATLKIKTNGGYEERPVMVKDVQYDHLGDRILHIDFFQISMERPVEVEVGIHLVGEAVGIKKGGIVEQHLHTVIIECLPNQIPEKIEVDISGLDIGDSIHLGEIKLPGIKILGSPDAPVLTIVPPTLEEEIAEVKETEPERIEKERKEEE